MTRDKTDLAIADGIMMEGFAANALEAFAESDYVRRHGTLSFVWVAFFRRRQPMLTGGAA